MPHSSRIKVREERFSFFHKNCEQFCVYRTSLVLLPDKSGQAGLPNKFGTVTGQVRSSMFSSIFDDCFERNFLTVSPIDPVLLPLGL
jgi:hypothetical protein